MRMAERVVAYVLVFGRRVNLNEVTVEQMESWVGGEISVN